MGQLRRTLDDNFFTKIWYSIMLNNPVFILGAGFSKSLFNNMPLMNELTSLVQKNLNSEIVSQNLNLNRMNFEELISYLWSSYPWKINSDHYENRSLYYKIIKLIESEFSKIELDFYNDIISQKKLPDDFYKLFNYWCDNRIKIITFNYDTLIEETIFEYSEKINNGTVKPFMKKIRDHEELWKLPIKHLAFRTDAGFLNGGQTISEDTIQLIKLHGSLNWYFYGDFKRSGGDYYYLNSYYNKEKDNHRFIAGLNKFIIPPTIDKTAYLQYNEIIKILWFDAKKFLANADELIIIGYSLPISDIYIRLFFQSCIKPNIRIIIVNIDNSQNFTNYIKNYFKNFNCTIEFCDLGPDTLRKFIDRYI